MWFSKDFKIIVKIYLFFRMSMCGSLFISFIWNSQPLQDTSCRFQFFSSKNILSHIYTLGFYSFPFILSSTSKAPITNVLVLHSLLSCYPLRSFSCSYFWAYFSFCILIETFKHLSLKTIWLFNVPLSVLHCLLLFLSTAIKILGFFSVLPFLYIFLFTSSCGLCFYSCWIVLYWKCQRIFWILNLDLTLIILSSMHFLESSFIHSSLIRLTCPWTKWTISALRVCQKTWWIVCISPFLHVCDNLVPTISVARGQVNVYNFIFNSYSLWLHHILQWFSHLGCIRNTWKAC